MNCVSKCVRAHYIRELFPRFQTTPNDPDNPIIAQYAVFYSDSCVCLYSMQYVPSGTSKRNKSLAIFRSVGILRFLRTN